MQGYLSILALMVSPVIVTAKEYCVRKNVQDSIYYQLYNTIEPSMSRIERMGENTAILRGSVSKISDDMPLYDVFYFYRILLFLQKGKGNKTAKKCFKLRGGISLPDLVNEGILETDGEMISPRKLKKKLVTRKLKSSVSKKSWRKLKKMLKVQKKLTKGLNTKKHSCALFLVDVASAIKSLKTC